MKKTTFSSKFKQKIPRGFYISKPIFRKKDQEKFKRLWNEHKHLYYEEGDAFSRKAKKMLSKVRKEGDDFLLENIEIKFINDVIGFGAFAKKDLPKGTILGEYVGMIKCLSPKEDEELSDKNGYLFEFTEIEELEDFVLDAKTYGNFIRFLNHARKRTKKENVEALMFCDKEAPHVLYVTKRAVKKGEELRLDYGEDTYWKNAKYKPV